MNLVEYIFDEARKRADWSKTALRFREEQISYSALYRLVRKAARMFREAGIAPGDRVAIVAADKPEFIVAFLGSIAAGAVAVPVNTMFPPEVLAYVLSNCGARGLVADREQAEKVRQCKKELTDLNRVWIADQIAETTGDGAESFRAAIEAAEESEIASAQDDLLAFILYTSGSTGPPKGAMHLHRSIPYMVNAACRQILNIRPEDRLFSSSRLFFAYGLGNGLYFPLSSGATAMLSDSKPTPQVIGSIFEHFKPTIFFGVPAVFRSLCQYVNEGNSLETGSIRFCVSAGEKLPETIYNEWKRLTGLDIVDHIGATEMLQMFISNRLDRIVAGSAGQPIPGCEVKLLDESGAEIIGPGAGELAARGGSSFAGYFNDPDRTAVALIDGWVHTRDMFRRDADGNYWFDGRADDLFKVKGQWVSPVEVEEALLACDEVSEVGVVAGTDATGLGGTVAYVVPLPNVTPGQALAAKLTAELASRLPAYKLPTEFRFVRALPRTATGKIQRFKLRDPEAKKFTEDYLSIPRPAIPRPG